MKHSKGYPGTGPDIECFICGRQVDIVEESEADNGTHLISVTCHGHSQTMKISRRWAKAHSMEWSMMQRGQLRGVAFKPRRSHHKMKRIGAPSA